MPGIRVSMAFAMLCAMPAPAYAYLDGATASMALQALIGAFAAAGLYSRRIMGFVKGLFRRQPGGRE
jgi:hypothetical protein